mgnify:CR=1 FL=1
MDLKTLLATTGGSIVITSDGTYIYLKTALDVTAVENIGSGEGLIYSGIVSNKVQLRSLLNYGGQFALISGTVGNNVRIKTLKQLNRIAISEDVAGGLGIGLSEGAYCKTVLVEHSNTGNVEILSDGDVADFGASKKAYIINLFVFAKDFAWTGGELTIEDTAGSDFIVTTTLVGTPPAANSVFFINDIPDGDFANGFRLGLQGGGGGAGLGIRIFNSVAGNAGKYLYVTVMGLIK